MKKQYFAFNTTSISFKIALGFLLIFLLFGLFISQFLKGSFEQKQILKDLIVLSNTASNVYDINKEVSEVQRLASVFSQTGSKSVLDKINLLLKKLEIQINEIKLNQELSESDEVIRNLKLAFQNYDNYLSSLEERYNYRDLLLSVQLPEMLNSGTIFLKKEIIKSNKSSIQKQILYRNMLSAWLEVDLYSSQFIAKRNYSLKENVSKNIEYLRGESLKLEKVERKELITILDKFQDVFDQSIQANRIYLSLVNVLIAGASLEISKLSLDLREITIKALNLLIQKNDEKYRQLEKTSFIVFLFTIPFILFIAIFYNKNIGLELRGLALTFEQFIKGNFNADISGLKRRDEIGVLARAAEEFRNVSREAEKSKNEALKLSKIKSEFLANMSHEIRTPLNGIIGMVNLIKEDELDTKHMEMIQTIDSCGENLLTILNDILDYSKIEAQKIDIENKPFLMRETIDDIYYLFKQTAKEKNLSLKLIVDDEINELNVMGDSTRLKQVLSNLVSNAIKFTQKGEVLIEVKLLQRKSEGSVVKFSIIDTGAGISASQIDNLFSPFTQADASITRRFGGTGLGLSISKNLVNLLGGELNVESEVGKCSSFNFSLTLKESIIEKDIKIKIDDSPKLFEKLKVLLVEDNIVNVKVATMMLKRYGIDCELASNGEIAVEKIKNGQQYDLIFMDIQMPVMDGITATKLIRSLPNGINIPIIAMTANAFDDDREKCLNAGMNDFLTKPLKKDLLELVLGKIIAKN